MNQTAKAYRLLQFDQWWKHSRQGRMEHSKYLARKAWLAAWDIQATKARSPEYGAATSSSGRFRHKIVCNGEVIAMFLHPPDRNWSIGVLKDEYPDCRFEQRDE